MASSKCQHPSIYLAPSPHADEVGFQRTPLEKRIGATTRSGRAPKTLDLTEDDISGSFPAPLVLPDDDLAHDPKCPPQSLRSWINNKVDYNPPTSRRCVVYVADAPEISSGVEFMRGWMKPNMAVSSSKSRKRKRAATKPTSPEDVLEGGAGGGVPLPKAEDVVKYLGAFYHGLEVKAPAPSRLRFVPWDASGSDDYVGFQTSKDNCVRVRTRPSPDGRATRQLNLSDLLDGLMDALPERAYSIALMVHHDLYEDEEDDFCCGRAYGASRICVVSSFRYHPDFDAGEGVDRAHMWPASHCAKYVDRVCGVKQTQSKSRVGGGGRRCSVADGESRQGAMHKAVSEVLPLPLPSSNDDLHHLWLSRFVRTASHELGHCMAIDHCVYYACVMQSTAGLVEDGRQPPYMCPVCLAKMTSSLHSFNRKANGERDVKSADTPEKYVVDRYRALLAVMEEKKWQKTGLFVGFRGWLEARLRQVDEDRAAIFSH
ncbi:hypothetical protein MKZ38_007221 [Zalerion maritima]|uniref:Archaemetzincin-2 n=1 Tax=Zalerion maritima TaxID=339359 RepID=A0AAD5RI72_9PEZI|nr:hypothetical protein MKZ38_007221 [Zalerion maritima]